MALFALSSGIQLRLQRAAKKNWGFHMVACTGSKAHLRKLRRLPEPLRQLEAGLVPDRNACSTVSSASPLSRPNCAKAGTRSAGEDRAASRSWSRRRYSRRSARPHRIERRQRFYRGDGGGGAGTRLRLSRHQRPFAKPEDRARRLGRGPLGADPADRQAESKLRGFRILKSSEVDILADGALDYPDDLLRSSITPSARSIRASGLAGKRRPSESCGRWTIAISISSAMRPDGCC